MNLNRLVGGYGEGPSAQEQIAKDASPQLRRGPRTIRESLQDQIAGYKAKIADLEAACEALTPDVEKALNALQKISY